MTSYDRKLLLVLCRLWDWLSDSFSELELDVDDLCTEARRLGLMAEVPYDPERHGEMDVEPGVLISYVTPLGARALKRGREHAPRR